MRNILSPLLIVFASCLALLLTSCADRAPKTALDPLGLGMDSPRYVIWVMTLPAGPPLGSNDGAPAPGLTSAALRRQARRLFNLKDLVI